MANEQAYLVALCDAIASELSFTQTDFVTPFDVERRFARIKDVGKISQSSKPLLLLHPAKTEWVRKGGGATPVFAQEYVVAMVLYARVGAGNDAEANCEPLMTLLDQIPIALADHQIKPAGYEQVGVVLQNVEGDPAYEMDWLIEDHVFVAPRLLTFARS